MDRSPNSPPQFSLAGLLAAITLVGICLAIMRIYPTDGAAALLLGLPALIRTLIVGRTRERTTLRAQAALLRESLAVSILAYVAATAVYVMLAGLVSPIAATMFDPETVGATIAFGVSILIIVVGVAAAFALVFWLTDPNHRRTSTPETRNL